MLQILLHHSQMPCDSKPVLFLHEEHYTAGLDISDTTRDREIKGHLVITETIYFVFHGNQIMHVSTHRRTKTQRHRELKVLLRHKLSLLSFHYLFTMCGTSILNLIFSNLAKKPSSLTIPYSLSSSWKYCCSLCCR